MLDIKYIREHSDLIEKGAKDKRIKFDLAALLKLDEEIRPLQLELEGHQAERNRISKIIPKTSDKSERQKLIDQVSAAKKQIELLGERAAQLGGKFDELMLHVPQPARADVPVGKDESDNIEVKVWGEKPSFDFPIKDHVELGEGLGIIDIPRGVKLAGSRSYVLRGAGSMLEHAIMRYTLDKLTQKGFVPLTIPVLVSEEAMIGTGYFPTGREQAYCVEKDNLALVGTGEVSLTSFYANEILKREDLPIRLVTLSSCFRREAGTYGKDTHGLYRVHQFQKIEQVIIAEADPAKSEIYHNELVANAEEVLQDLGLAYRVVYVCTGDLGQGQLRKHDIETWMPSRGAYSETHSCSTFHDFQARRLKMRYRDENHDTVHCYTLNNTAIASPRVLIPLLEMYQQKDGSVVVPPCLRPFMNGLEVIRSP